MDGTVNDSVEGTVEGTVDGTVDGTVNGTVEGTVDGTVEGFLEVQIEQQQKTILEMRTQLQQLAGDRQQSEDTAKKAKCQQAVAYRQLESETTKQIATLHEQLSQEQLAKTDIQAELQAVRTLAERLQQELDRELTHSQELQLSTETERDASRGQVTALEAQSAHFERQLEMSRLQSGSDGLAAALEEELLQERCEREVIQQQLQEAVRAAAVSEGEIQLQQTRIAEMQVDTYPLLCEGMCTLVVLSLSRLVRRLGWASALQPHAHTLTHSHTLLITCTCCYDQIKRTQDKDFSCSFSDSL